MLVIGLAHTTSDDLASTVSWSVQIGHNQFTTVSTRKSDPYHVRNHTFCRATLALICPPLSLHLCYTATPPHRHTRQTHHPLTFFLMVLWRLADLVLELLNWSTVLERLWRVKQSARPAMASTMHIWCALGISALAGVSFAFLLLFVGAGEGRG
jgi:hypothetical protein